MRATLWALGLIVLLGMAAAPATTAQTLPSDTFIVFVGPINQMTTHIYRIDAAARIVATIAALPPRYIANTITMAADNRSIRVTGYLQGLPRGSFVLEISPLGQVSTIYLGAQMLQPHYSFMDDDGGWVVTEGVAGGTQFWRMNASGVTSLGLAKASVYGLARDPERDQLICRTGAMVYPPQYGYSRINYRTGNVVSLASTPTTISAVYRGAAYMPYEPTSGAVVDLSFGMMSTLLGMWRVHPQTGTKPLRSLNFTAIPTDLTRASQRTTHLGYYLLGQHSTTSLNPYGLFHVGREGAIHTFHLNPTIYWFVSTLTREGSRNLHWSLDYPPNGRSLHLSFPGEAGRPYIAAVGASGIRPGIPLPDGRVVSIVPDALTFACARGGVPGLIAGTVGTLDTTGRARVRFNGNALGKVVKGLRLWAAALVVDPKAPSGVAWVTNPTAVTFK